jgi:hypothetical protein
LQGRGYEPHQPNSQTTAFCAGKMFAFVLSSEFPEIPPAWDWRTAPSANSKLRHIWPIQEPHVEWPPAAMTDEEARACPIAVANYMDDLALRAGYETTSKSPPAVGRRAFLSFWFSGRLRAVADKDDR